jgi:hypothetical protein
MQKIMFNDKYGLTTAVLAGTKTQTRRLVPDKLLSRYGHNKFNDRSTDFISDAPFKVGEVVAVAQKYRDIPDYNADLYDDDLPSYSCSGGSSLQYTQGWDNKMFVKADLMPHQIEITDIRVQRLQDISDEDCITEGIMRFPDRFTGDIVYSFQGCGYNFDYPITAYSELIDSISGKGTFERNPWVFAYNFKLIKYHI